MPTDDDAAAAHKRFAIDLYNATWDLLEKPDRSPEEDRRMLSSAFASRHHWDALGKPEQTCVGDWMVANVASRLGYADVALAFARAAVDAAEANDGFADYVLASCYEGMARAFACAGDDAECDRFVGASKSALARIVEDDDRALIEEQLRSVPGYR